MAKVTAPLMSMSATGKFGSIVFDPRNFARRLVTPTNPKSGSQGDVRQKLAAVQAALKLAGTTAKNAIKAVAPTGYRWNSFMVQQAIGTGGGTYDDSHTAFAALSGGDQTSWNSAFSSINVPDITYSTMSTPSDGEAAFILCRALFASGAITSPGTPVGGNSAAWHTALVA